MGDSFYDKLQREKVLLEQQVDVQRYKAITNLIDLYDKYPDLMLRVTSQPVPVKEPCTKPIKECIVSYMRKYGADGIGYGKLYRHLRLDCGHDVAYTNYGLRRILKGMPEVCHAGPYRPWILREFVNEA